MNDEQLNPRDLEDRRRMDEAKAKSHKTLGYDPESSLPFMPARDNMPPAPEHALETRTVNALDYDGLCEIIRWCGGTAIDHNQNVIRVGSVEVGDSDTITKIAEGSFMVAKKTAKLSDYAKLFPGEHKDSNSVVYKLIGPDWKALPPGTYTCSVNTAELQGDTVTIRLNDPVKGLAAKPRGKMFEYYGKIPQGVWDAVKALADIADAFDRNELDDEARKYWGENLTSEYHADPEQTELYTSRGGKRLLTLADCLKAREALKAVGYYRL